MTTQAEQIGTLENASHAPNAKTRKRNLHALTRRAEYLRQILAADTGPRAGRDYDIAELSALRAAIEIVRKHYADTNNHRPRG